MNQYNLYTTLTTITFITSESCNLNCSYCEIAKDATSSHASEVIKVQQALASGQYLANYKKCLVNYNIPSQQIRKLELWGQEPTLTLNEFTSQIDDILCWLPNCEDLFFSTNGMAYPDRIINLIKKINNFVKIKNRNFTLCIQFSIDGLGQDIEARGANPETIIKNIKTIVKELNNYQIDNNFKILFIFHGVLTLDIMKNGIKNNTILSHWKEMDEVINDIYLLNTNPKVCINSTLNSAFVNPYNATKEEGQIAAEYLRQCYNIANELKRISLAPEEIFMFHTKMYKRFDGSFDTIEEGNEYVRDLCNFKPTDIVSHDAINFSFGCGAGNNDIKMRYDGTVLYCHNNIFSLSEEDLKNKQGIRYDLQHLMLKYNYQKNILTSSKEEMLQYLTKFDTKKHSCYPFSYINTVNLMDILLETNQIDESYKTNKEKLLRHVLYICRFNQCWFNQLTETGSLYTRTLGTLRFYCNGLMDLIENYAHERGNSLWN